MLLAIILIAGALALLVGTKSALIFLAVVAAGVVVYGLTLAVAIRWLRHFL